MQLDVSTIHLGLCTRRNEEEDGIVISALAAWKYVLGLLLAGGFALQACGGGEVNVDIDATVEARLEVERDIDAKVKATVQALAPVPSTPTSRPVSTSAAVSVRSFDSTAVPIPTRLPEAKATPTLVPSPSAEPTVTPLPKKLSVEEMVRQSLPAIVRVKAGGANGTGFIYEVRGRTAHVVTNAHVIKGAGERVRLDVGDIEYEGQVLGVDETKDIAVLSVCCGSFQSLQLSGRGVELGQEVIAIGYALGLEGDPTVTRGVVSAVRHSTELNVNLIQTDAPINRGNSGGPMLSMDGLVVGMNTSKISGAAIDAVGFAIVSQAVMLTAPALVSTDVVMHKGRKFVRKAGPSEIIGSGTLFISYVQAKDFVAEVRVVDPAARIAFVVTGFTDSLQPGQEMIAAVGKPHGMRPLGRYTKR